MSSLNDRRTRFTKGLIKDTYLSLLQDKTPSKITVANICAEADINRSTFYVHYRDAESVFEDIENEVYDEWVGIILHMPDNQDDVQTFCNNAYSQLFQKKAFRYIFLHSQPGGVRDRITEGMGEAFSRTLMRFYELPAALAEVKASFMIGGTMLLWQKILRKNLDFSPEQNDYVQELMLQLFGPVSDSREFLLCFIHELKTLDTQI